MDTTHWYVDTTLATGANDGTSPADAWQSLTTALTYASFISTTINVIWVRRVSSHVMVASINIVDDGFADRPIYYIGWPRSSNNSATGGSWTNDSNEVSSITGISLVRSEHQGRYVTAPNGNKYIITRVIDSATMNIDRPYGGSTVTLGSGTFTIHADEWYEDRSSAGIAAGWDSDGEALPLVDGNSTAFRIASSVDLYFNYVCIEFLNSAYTNGLLYTNVSGSMLILGCLFKTNSDNTVFLAYNSRVHVYRCIIEGSGSGTSQTGLYVNGECKVTDSAIYNCGGYGSTVGNNIVDFDNVNIGVEIANVNDDINIQYGSIGKCVDLSLGGTNGYINRYLYTDKSYGSSIENYQKILGDNKTWYTGGEYISTAVASETPNKKLSDTVLKITPNHDLKTFLDKEQRIRIPLGIVNMDAGSQTVKFWFYNGLRVILNENDPELDIYLEAEYVDNYSDEATYTKTKVNSTEQDILPEGSLGSTLTVNGDNEAAAMTASASRGVFSQSSEQAHGGTYSGKFTLTSAIGAHYVFWLHSYFDPDDLVYTETWVYLPSGQSINIIELNMGGIVVDSTTVTDTWVKLSGYHIFTTGTQYVSIRTNDTGASMDTEYIYIDDTITQLVTPDLDDWDSLSVTVNPAVESLVNLNLVARYYDASNDFFIDPQMVIT